jgi:integrase
MASGYIRERNGRFYVRTRVLVVDPHTGESRYKQVEKAAGSSRRGAQRMLRGLQGDVQDGRFTPCAATVLELGNRWLSEHVQPNLKPGAAASYRSTFYHHVAPVIGHLRLDDCGAQAVRMLLVRKRSEGVTEQGIAKIRRQMHAMFAFAQDAGLMSVNPADLTRARGPRLSHRRQRGTELSPVQIKRFLDQCPPRWRRFFTVALDTGLRRGELIGLRWADVDLLERTIHVHRSIGPYDDPHADGLDGGEGLHEGELGIVAMDSSGRRENGSANGFHLSAKTDAGHRLVPILDNAQQALEELYAAAADTREHAPVFATVERKPGRDGATRPTGRPLCPRMVSRVFRRYADRAGLPASVRLHDLRHTAITNAIGQGEDILLVAAFAGHAKTSTTVDVYGHLMPDRVRAAAQRMRSVAGPSPQGVANHAGSRLSSSAS